MWGKKILKESFKNIPEYTNNKKKEKYSCQRIIKGINECEEMKKKRKRIN